MVITKLWKDIHPKHIRVENYSICCKNIAPCSGAIEEKNVSEDLDDVDIIIVINVLILAKLRVKSLHLSKEGDETPI